MKQKATERGLLRRSRSRASPTIEADDVVHATAVEGLARELHFARVELHGREARGRRPGRPGRATGPNSRRSYRSRATRPAACRRRGSRSDGRCRGLPGADSERTACRLRDRPHPSPRAHASVRAQPPARHETCSPPSRSKCLSGEPAARSRADASRPVQTAGRRRHRLRDALQGIDTSLSEMAETCHFPESRKRGPGPATCAATWSAQRTSRRAVYGAGGARRSRRAPPAPHLSSSAAGRPPS